MKKVILFLLASCLTCMYIVGEEIPLRTTTGNHEGGEGPKSPIAQVSASLERDILTLFFTPSASCQVTITDSQTNTVVYSGVFGVDSTQTIPLTTLPAGNYELSVFAYGAWWEGEFEIE